MKLKLVTAEEATYIISSRALTPTTPQNVADSINKLIEYKMKVGYVNKEQIDSPESNRIFMTKVQMEIDTHKIYYITQPIQEKKVECGICTEDKPIYKQNSDGQFMNFQAQEKKFCYECGEKQ